MEAQILIATPGGPTDVWDDRYYESVQGIIMEGSGADQGSMIHREQEAGITSASRGVTLLLVFSILGDVVSWDERLDRPIDLPDGKTLLTLEDARRYILKLPKSELETVAWQVAIEALVIAAEERDR